MEEETFIVLVGNPVDGIVFYGPFKEHEQAQLWAEDNVESEADWWIGYLRPSTWTKFDPNG